MEYNDVDVVGDCFEIRTDDAHIHITTNEGYERTSVHLDPKQIAPLIRALRMSRREAIKWERNHGHPQETS